MTKWTKGPLTIKGPSPGGTAYDDGGDYAIIDADGNIVGEAINKLTRDEYGAIVYGPAKANAQLWAAAPALYEALEEAENAITWMPDDVMGLDHDTGYPYKNELLDQLRAALALACFDNE